MNGPATCLLDENMLEVSILFLNPAAHVPVWLELSDHNPRFFLSLEDTVLATPPWLNIPLLWPETLLSSSPILTVP